MKKNLEEMLADYHSCSYYDENRMQAALNGDVIEISNIGTDFAKCQMFTEANECWEYCIESRMPTNPEAYTNLGVSYFYGNGVEVNYEKRFTSIRKPPQLGIPLGSTTLLWLLNKAKALKLI